MSDVAGAASVERVATLRRELEAHLYRYHVLDAPSISDAEYDRADVKDFSFFRRMYPGCVVLIAAVLCVVGPTASLVRYRGGFV